jgi:hypothetical protein
LCPATLVVQEAWSLSSGPSGSKSSLVSKPSLVDTMIMPMQSSVNTTPLLGIDASLNHVVSHLVQLIVVPMQYLTDTTHVFGGDASLDHVVSHPIQPIVEEVVVSMQSLVDPNLLLESENSKEVTLPMQSSVNPTLFFGGDASFDHVLSISSSVPSEPRIIPLSLSTLPQSTKMVSFDQNDLVDPFLPSYAPFQIRGILRYIVDEGSYTSILSSSA